MEIMNKLFSTASSGISQIVDLGIKLLAMGVVLQLIFGAAVPFLGIYILANVIKFVAALGSQGLVGLVALGVLFWSFDKNKT